MFERHQDDQAKKITEVKSKKYHKLLKDSSKSTVQLDYKTYVKLHENEGYNLKVLARLFADVSQFKFNIQNKSRPKRGTRYKNLSIYQKDQMLCERPSTTKNVNKRHKKKLRSVKPRSKRPKSLSKIPISKSNLKLGLGKDIKQMMLKISKNEKSIAHD